jgi:Flp pilus assembly pilin Flp
LQAAGAAAKGADVMKTLRNWAVRFVRDERGMESVEWAVLAAILVAATATAIVSLGGHVTTKFNALNTVTS